jgi:starch synthase
VIERVLFVTPEVHPFNKTGGLGDVSYSLVRALNARGVDARLAIPGYPAIRRHVRRGQPVAPLLDAQGREGCLIDAELEENLRAFVVDFPAYFGALESPYENTRSDDIDEASRFLELARAAAKIGLGQVPGWQPDVVHSNDWTTGMVPLLLHDAPRRPGTVFTIHNLAFQGLFPRERFDELGLDSALWSPEALEFYGQLSFMKGGLVFADRLNTVSPSYAREITTPEHGCGLEGLLDRRSEHLSGILNGVDYTVWHPACDPLIASSFDARDLRGKHACKRALQEKLGLEPSNAALFGMVSRLTEQKGVDVLLACVPELLSAGAQLAVLGSGAPELEAALKRAAATAPEQLAVRLGYDEPLSHQIIAGADFFVMPSRFEPCGLTQLYSLAYGTVPVVHATGGLADTVVDAGPESIAAGEASGLSYAPNTPASLAATLQRALELYGDDNTLRALRQSGMAREFSWARSAEGYLELYEEAQRAARGAA